MADPVDTIIIGAGLSGLQAAISLHEAERSVLVLEARDRVGGKTYSVNRPDGKGVQEMGAAWLNDSSQAMVWSYVERFGLTPVLQNIEGSVACQDEDGSCHMFPFGGLPKFEQHEVDNITSVRDSVEAASLDPATFQPPKRDHLDHITFERFCRDLGATAKALRSARVWCRGTLGQDPCDVSALAYLEVCRGAGGVVKLRYDGKDGAQYLRLREGTQSISINMASILPNDAVRLSSPVVSVSQTSDKTYKVTTTTGETFTARTVVVSIPSPAYKSITFDPPLPAARQSHIASAYYGTFVKYICTFRSPFWRRKGACGLTQSFCGPMNHCRDTSVDQDENYALTCFLCAGPGREWLGLEKQARREVVLKQLASLFDVGFEEVEAEFLGDMTSEWTEDPFAGWGCPFPVVPMGYMGQDIVGDVIRGGIDGIFLVGTEWTNEWRGYMEGALRTGKNGADLVLARLRK